MPGLNRTLLLTVSLWTLCLLALLGLTPIAAGAATCAKPTRLVAPAMNQEGHYAVQWGRSATPRVSYVLEEATDPSFTLDRRSAYIGTGLEAIISGRLPGTVYYYRVRATRPGMVASPWKTGAWVSVVGPAPAPPLVPLAVTKYRAAKKAALAITFDDGLESVIAKGVPILDRYGFKATMYINPARVGSPNHGSWQEWQELQERGYEIGSHSLKHLHLGQMTNVTMLRHEIGVASARILANLGRAPRTFAFPFASLSGVALDTVHARGMISRDEFNGRTDSRRVNYNQANWSLEAVKADIDTAIAKNVWIIWVLHGIDEGYMPIAEDFFQEVIDYLASRQTDLEIDTFEHIARYQETVARSMLYSTNESSRGMTFVVAQEDQLPQPTPAPLTVALSPPCLQILSASIRTGSAGRQLDSWFTPNQIVITDVPSATPVEVEWQCQWPSGDSQ